MRRKNDYMSNIDEPLYKVGEVAHLYGVTVRTLHYWEDAGLLAPSGRTGSNYRLYTQEECERIQHILIYRATGLKLAEIRDVLDSDLPNFKHLQRQRERLLEQREELDVMVMAIDKLLENDMKNDKLSNEEIGKIIGDAKFAEHYAEAEDLYGDTDEWQVSQQQTSSWNAGDWSAQKERFDTIDEKLADTVRRGVAVDSPEAGALVAEHRELLSQFYPVSPAKHYIISRTYVSDDRFRSHYDDREPGLAQWLADAVAESARQAGVDLENPEWE